MTTPDERARHEARAAKVLDAIDGILFDPLYPLDQRASDLERLYKTHSYFRSLAAPPRAHHTVPTLVPRPGGDAA